MLTLHISTSRGSSAGSSSVKAYFQELRATGHSIESITATASRNAASGAIRSSVGQAFRKFLQDLGTVPPTNTVTLLTNMSVFSPRSKVAHPEGLHDEEDESSVHARKRMRTE